MAEALMRKCIDEKHSGNPDGEAGIQVLSAGISASAGCAASPEAVEIMKQYGLDLSEHCSQPLTDKLVQHADVIYTLTSVHRQAILERWPAVAPRTHCLRPDNGDVDDPIGAGIDVYRRCAAQIESAVRQRIDQLLTNHH